MNIHVRYLAAFSSGPIVMLAFLSALFGAGMIVGASRTPSQLASLQARRPDSVVMFHDLRYNGAFKVAKAAIDSPDVVWLSTSRAGTATAEMFKPYRFYNMSFTAWTTKQLEEIFDRATFYAHPKLVIISLDYFMFTDDYDRGYGTSREMIYNTLPFAYLRSSLSDFATALSKHTEIFLSYAKSPNNFVGTQGILSHEGFRADGSYVYSAAHVESANRSQKIADFLIRSFPGAPEMSRQQKAAIDELSNLAETRNIKVIAVQLPYVKTAIEFLDHDENYRHYSGLWREFESAKTRDWLRERNIELFDLARSNIADDSDNFVDAYHPSALGMERCLKELAAMPAFREALPKLELIQQ